MKIYPNKSKIIVTNNVNLATDIPLSYIDTQKIEYSINTVVESNYNTKLKQEILPYDKVNNNLICLFDEYNNLIDPVEMTKYFKRENGDYIYVPYNCSAYEPYTFQYNVTAKKNLSYNSKMQYDLKIAASDAGLANTIMPIFGDAPNKGYAPSNIFVNSGSVSYGDLITGNLREKDFLFTNLQTLDLDQYDNEFNIDSILNYKTNIFAFMLANFAKEINNNDTIEKDEVKMFIQEDNIAFKLKNPLIYNDISFSTKTFFNVPNDSNEIIYHNLFNNPNKTPILIEEHIGKGFVIYASDELTREIVNNSKLMYEMLFYVYSRTYLLSSTYTEWITDVMPDFIVVNNKLVKKEKFLSQIELNAMFGLNKYEVSVHSVNIDVNRYPYVDYVGLTDSYLTFTKNTENNETYKDPIKKDSAISIYTARQNIVYFEKFMYKIDDSLKDAITVERVNNELRVLIKPFRHSSSGIYIPTNSSFVIPLSYTNTSNENIQITNADFYIVCKNNSSASYFEYVNADNYSLSCGEILATIQVRQDETSTLVYDMRQRGGGLPESENDVYDCFDIGHIYGRPYRKGGSIVITLPKKLEQHKELINDTIKQYCVAEEYPIIIFKED